MIACLLLATPVESSLLLPHLTNFTPLVEADGTTFFLNLGQLAHHRPADLLDQLNQAIHPHLPQPPRLGLAVGKFPAQLAAATLGPGRGLVIVPGCEADFLRPLPIGLLPLDEALARQFELLGLHTLGHLANLPTGAVLNRFGRSGRWLQQLARGRDERPVHSVKMPLIEQASHVFEMTLTDRVQLENLLQELLDLLANRLRAAHRICRTIQLTITLADGAVLRESIALRQATQQAATMGLVVQSRLARLDLWPGVSEVRVSLVGLESVRGEQMELFGPARKQGQLQAHLPELLARFGPERFYTVELTAPDSHLPERRFRLTPAEGE